MFFMLMKRMPRFTLASVAKGEWASIHGTFWGKEYSMDRAEATNATAAEEHHTLVVLQVPTP